MLSVLAFVVLGLLLLTTSSADGRRLLARLDVALTVFFLLEFFTRTGFRQHPLAYAASRWFDFLAMVPAAWLLVESPGTPLWLAWVILVARAGRVVDRTLGDGFFVRNLVGLLDAVEEEISDRVVVKILTRVQAELVDARFGQAAADALRANRNAILERIYKEQLRDAGLLGSFASITGLQAALEKSERRLFDSITEMVGSPETDAMIADIVRQTLERAKKEIGQKSWRSRFAVQKGAGLGS